MPPSMTRHTMPCLGPHGFHRLAYAAWHGPAEGPVALCVHGLTRNGRDFDALAERLARRGSVLVPDMAGRGDSEWLADPADYGYPLYLADTAALIARSGAAEVDFVGTSMGGIIGMMLAAQPGSPIRRLVVNDVGPLVPKAALERIAGYVGADPLFPDLAALERYCRLTYAEFGRLSDAEWRRFAEVSARPQAEGGYGLAYDPAIGRAFQGPLEDVSFWPVYDRIRCPVLVIRGGRSTLLTEETARAMAERGPRAACFTVPDAGHAPALLAPDQIAAIERFLA